MLWHTVAREALTWRELDGELVVLNARTGSTHLLESLASEVFRILVEARGGLSLAELVTRLSEGMDAQGDWPAAVEAVLSEFQRLGLAEPTD